MLKRISAMLLLVTILVVCSFSAFAAAPLASLLKNTKTESTDQFLVTITRPEGDESTFKKSYVLCGVTELENIRVHVLLYDDVKDEYVPYMDFGNDGVWDIGISGIFMKEIDLTKGANKIRIAAYKKSNANNLKLKQTLQVNNFTVTLLDEDGKDAFKSSILNIKKYFKY
ncbi:MAG: hypothetical protein N2645_23695 [Clostridia bacterium]|nr:hypothetical protein [Clostridia bacterium]